MKLRPNPHRFTYQNCGVCYEFLTPNEQYMDPRGGPRARRVVCESCGKKRLAQAEAVAARRAGRFDGQQSFKGVV